MMHVHIIVTVPGITDPDSEHADNDLAIISDAVRGALDPLELDWHVAEVVVDGGAA